MGLSICGYLLIIIAANEVVAKIYPLFLNEDPNKAQNNYVRIKRQFGFQQPFENNNGFGFNDANNGFAPNDIFFDDDNMFQDFVMPNRPETRRNQNNGFPNNQNFFGSNSGIRNPSTQRPIDPSTDAVPGMGTTQSACEDRCLTTSQYNPVCGDNNVTYNNIEKFKCALRCGRNVQIAAYRACPRV